MDKQLEDRIRERAYELWMQNGCLPGRDEEYWYQAEQEVRSRTGDQSAEQVGGQSDRQDNEESLPLDTSPAPLGMTSQTTDEQLAGTDANQAAPAAKTRKRRSSAASTVEGGTSTGEPPKRKRTTRTP